MESNVISIHSQQTQLVILNIQLEVHADQLIVNNSSIGSMESNVISIHSQ